jgi:putative oxidoreductase
VHEEVVCVSAGLLILRVVVGLLFIGHGTQKLFGWFGGGGLEGTSGFFGSLGYRSSRTMALVGGLTETVGGVFVLLGLLTPLGSAMIVGMMVSAIVSVHIDKGLWNSNGGIEFPLVLIASATAIAFGPGRYAMDRALGFSWDGKLSGVLALSVGLLVGVVVDVMMRSTAAPTIAADEPTEEHRAAA